jgi:peptide/nickel transport system substrate-binding protein
VDRRRARRQEELRSQVPASAGIVPPQERRTATRLRCGVFLLAVLCGASCQHAGTQSSAPRDVLTIGFPEGAISSADQGVAAMTNGLSLEGLTQVSPDGRPLPRLADSWVWENDGRALRIKLRSGVTFHDGTPLTSNVAATALRAAIAKPANRALYPSLNDVTAIRPVNELELALDVSAPSAFLPEDLDLPLGIGPQNVGTGPFRVVTRDRAEIVLERNDRYYLAVPQIKRLVIRPFDTLRTAWTSLLRGQVDMVTDVPFNAVEFISNDAVQVIPFERRYQFLVAFNSERQPFRSPKVRRALNAAIDRQALIKNVLQGHGTPSTGPIWPKYWAYDSGVGSYGFDPTLVASLLDEAGYPFDRTAPETDAPHARLRFTCILPADFSIVERVALEIQKQLYNVGVDTRFQVLPVDDYNSRIQTRQFDCALLDSISGPTPGRTYIFWRSGKHSRGLNVFGYENPEAERLYEILRTSINDGAVRSATRGLQRVFLDDPPALFLAWNERARAVRRDFQIPQEPGRDPLQSLWRWTPTAPPIVQTASVQ